MLEAAAALLPLPCRLLSAAEDPCAADADADAAAAATPLPFAAAADVLGGEMAVSSSAGGGTLEMERLLGGKGHTLGSCAVLLPTNPAEGSAAEISEAGHSSRMLARLMLACEGQL